MKGLLLTTGQVLKEIESKAAFSAQQLQIVRGQITSKTREKRMLQLSSSELDTLPKETPVYDGVGKMFAAKVQRSQWAETDRSRFVLTTIPQVKDQQSKQSGDVDKEMENLNKKLHYLETTYKNANEHMERIFKGSS